MSSFRALVFLMWINWEVLYPLCSSIRPKNNRAMISYLNLTYMSCLTSNVKSSIIMFSDVLRKTKFKEIWCNIRTRLKCRWLRISHSNFSSNHRPSNRWSSHRLAPISKRLLSWCLNSSNSSHNFSNLHSSSIFKLHRALKLTRLLSSNRSLAPSKRPLTTRSAKNSSTSSTISRRSKLKS